MEESGIANYDIWGMTADVSDGEDGVPDAAGPSLSAAHRDCGHCWRPSKACLCQYLPTEPLPIHSSVVVLQHPAESKRRLQTARLAGLVVGGQGAAGGFHLISCRRIKREEHSSLLPEGFWASVDRGRVLVLFPGAAAVPIATVVENLTCRQGVDEGGGHDSVQVADRIVLIVIDGTWKQAKEMWRELKQNRYLGDKIHQVTISIPPSERGAATSVSGQQPESGILRKQPAKGCVTTLEAIAYALFDLEKVQASEQAALQVRDALLRPLHAMVRIQIDHGASSISRTYGEQSKLAKTLVS